MSVIRFKETEHLDKTLYYQCREYVKLCLMVEELQLFIDENEDSENTDIKCVIKDTDFKAGLLLVEFKSSLDRLKEAKKND